MSIEHLLPFPVQIIFGIMGLVGTIASFTVSKDVLKKELKTFKPFAYLSALKHSKTPKVEFYKDIFLSKSKMKRVMSHVNLILNSKKSRKEGFDGSCNVLLEGPPGTGKTLFAEGLANHIGYNYYKVVGSEFAQKYVGDGPKSVEAVFTAARSLGKCVLFIDEVDCIARNRSSEAARDTATINQLLVELGDNKKNKDIVIVLATNLKNSIDPAVIRSGRIGLELHMDLPTTGERVSIIKLLLSKFENSVSKHLIKFLADWSEGLSHADLGKIVNDAFSRKINKNDLVLTSKHLYKAFIDFSLGVKNDVILSPKELKETAIHEAGHALMAWYWNYYKVFWISIVPRRHFSGVTCTVSQRSNVHTQTKCALFSNIMLSLGGRAAEEVFFGSINSGASRDLDSATDVLKFMSNRLGMIDGLSVSKNNFKLSLKEKKQMDDILEHCYLISKTLMENYKGVIEQIKNYLLEHKNMPYYEFQKIMNEQKRIKVSELLRIVHMKKSKKNDKMISELESCFKILKVKRNDNDSINIEEIIDEENENEKEESETFDDTNEQEEIITDEEPNEEQKEEYE